MPEKTWKRAERIIARSLGGRRLPVSGRGDRPDIEHPWLSIEVKHRARLPRWLADALRQAERAARPEQLPIVILHEDGQRYGDSLVVLRLRAFREWFGPVDGREESSDGKT